MKVLGSPKVSRFRIEPFSKMLRAGVVQRLVYKFSKLGTGVRFPPPAPFFALVAQLDRAGDF